MQEGDIQCVYCRPKNSKTLIAGKAAYLSAWAKIYTNSETDIRLGLSAEGESRIGTSIEIFYCPICGRKLRE